VVVKGRFESTIRDKLRYLIDPVGKNLPVVTAQRQLRSSAGTSPSFWRSRVSKRRKRRGLGLRLGSEDKEIEWLSEAFHSVIESIVVTRKGKVHPPSSELKLIAGKAANEVAPSSEEADRTKIDALVSSIVHPLGDVFATGEGH
jgi:hypothetical protein